MALTQVSSNRCAGGFQKVFEHESTELKCKMKFAVYLPPKAETDKCPVMYWLSGLTCTEQNFITKAGSQVPAAEHGLIVVAPDTSPRGCNIEGEDENWDFGTGAGFYVNATQDPWKTNYRMYSYITEELPKLINANFPTDPDKMSISGHSMGGHGALICALKNPGKYKAVSAFAPICNPMQCPWGQKAFSGYLGPDRSAWEAYDATVLAAAYCGPQLDVLIDQGRDDQFLSASQLLPDNLIAVCSEKKVPVVFRLQPVSSNTRLLTDQHDSCMLGLRPQLLLHLLLHERSHQAPRQVPQRLISHHRRCQSPAERPPFPGNQIPQL
uniref:S-formylglutathione hydrolase n=1 Tax=Gasterosteus aculeatus aculeatus TaxID=481459 RepID=G3NZG1_GASAC